MTKQSALEQFKSNYANFSSSLRSDRIAISEDWCNYTDMLCSDGEITEKQCNTWSNPF